MFGGLKNSFQFRTDILKSHFCLQKGVGVGQDIESVGFHDQPGILFVLTTSIIERN